MAVEQATSRGYPLPHPDNVARTDAQRIRDAIQSISTEIDAIVNTIGTATTTKIGQVRLATAGEATAGTATNAVPTVKSTKDMIVASVNALSDALTAVTSALSDIVDENVTDIDALETAVSSLTSATNAALAARVLLAGGQTLTGGFDTTSVPTYMSSGTFKPNPKLGAIHNVTNGGAHTLVPPDTPSTVVLEYTNNANAGALTVSGFSKVTGLNFSAANGARHLLYITRTSAVAHLHIVAI